jgi:hypothetical protein
MILTGDTGASGTLNQNPPDDAEASMLRLFQRHMVTHMRPLLDHVDQLFKTVESLSSDLDDERARSRRHHDEISLRLEDIDRMVTSRPIKVANAVEEQRDCDIIVRARLEQWFAEILEPSVQEHSDRKTERLSNFDGQMQALIASSLQPSLEENQMKWRHLDSFSSRLSVAETGIETIAKSLQDQQLFIDLVVAQTAKLGDGVKSVLAKMHDETQLKFNGPDGCFTAADRFFTDRLDVIVEEEEQQSTMSELTSSLQEKLSSIQGGFEKLSKIRLAAAHGRLEDIVL